MDLYGINKLRTNTQRKFTKFKQNSATAISFLFSFQRKKHRGPEKFHVGIVKPKRKTRGKTRKTV